MKTSMLELSAAALPVIEGNVNGEPIAPFINEHRERLEAEFRRHGALLFRSFDVHDVEGFTRFVDAWNPAKMDYVYGSSPRTSLGDRIFSSTDHPPSQSIELHNECSYQTEWPLQIAFCCLQAAAQGGETPIADTRRVTALLDASIVAKFEQRQVRYVRNYRQHVDVPWQKVFQTEDRSEVERLCAERDMTFEWLADGTLRTTQIAQGVALHPDTKERYFFNQAHLFHVSSLGTNASAAMLQIFGRDGLPKQTYFADGEDIPMEDLAAIRAAFKAAESSFPWREGDILLLDNMRFAHGRRPFSGARRVVTAMMQPYRNDPLSAAGRGKQ